MTTTHTSLTEQQEAVIADLDGQVQVLLDLMASTRDRFTEAIIEAKDTDPTEGGEVASILIHSGGAFLHDIQHAVETGVGMREMWRMSLSWDGSVDELVTQSVSVSDREIFPF